MKIFTETNVFRAALSTVLLLMSFARSYAIYVDIDKYTYEITRFWGSGVNGDTQAMIVGIASGENVCGDVVIPDSITYNGERYPVVGVGEGDFSGILEGKNPAFYKNSQITSVTFPSTIRFIGSNEFLDCQNIENYYVAPDSKHFTAEDGILYELNYSYDQEKITYELFRYPSARRTTTLAVPGKASTIGAGAFAANNHLRVIILSGDQSLNTRWQLGNKTIENVDCKSSTHYSQPEDGVLIMGNTFKGVCPAFNRASYTIPETIRYISEGAFCESPIREIIIPETVTNPLSQYEFMNSAVERINFQGNLPYDIPQGCFINAASLTSLSLQGDTNGKLWLSSSCFLGCKSLESITFQNNIKTIKIGRQAFMGCINLKEFPVTAGMKISELNSYAFKGCRSLTNFSLAGVDEIESVPGYQFEESGLTYVNWPSHITKVPYGCFRNCRDLTKVNLKMTTTDISSDAFSGSGLTAISMMGVEWYAHTAFYNCPNLSRVYFPINERQYVNYRDLEFIPESSEVIVNNPNIRNLDNQSPSDRSEVKLYTSIFSPLSKVGDSWACVYVAGGAKEIYKSLTASEVREMYRYTTDKANSRVRISDAAPGVKLTGVVIEGVAAELKDGWWQADCQPSEGIRMNVSVNYTVYGNPMTTNYEYQFDADGSGFGSIADEISTIIKSIGSERIILNSPTPWQILSANGMTVLSGATEYIDLTILQHGIYILHLPEQTSANMKFSI